MKLEKILLATDNPHKQEKLKWLVGEFFKQIDLPKRKSRVKESGEYFEEIAKNKALGYGQNYDGFVIATDGGMEIPSLGNSWNALLTKRFKEGTDFDRMDALLFMMQGKRDRRMQWQEAVAVSLRGKIIFSTTVEGAKGVLQTSYDKKKYKRGIWLCSLWYFPTYKRNYFDLKPREVDFAEVSWLRLKRKVQDYFSVAYFLREEQNQALDGLNLLPAFTLENWPHDPLMTTIKSKVLPIVEREAKKTPRNYDFRDLTYQVLFRLTTYGVDEIFNKEVERYLRKKGVFKDWKKLLTISTEFLNKFPINEVLVKKVFYEQLAITQYRVKKSKLPIQEIINPRNEIFKTSDWVIKREYGKIFAVMGRKKRELIFRRVDKRYAKRLHKFLHYIHQDRVQEAFGLFIKGEKIPFSVLGVEKIDRQYKKTTVLLKGYDYNKVVDFTRLYSFPNSPTNTSSVMFSLTRDYYRKKGSIQAVLSAFMPSYANGMSMFAGGMDTVLIAKELKHSFIKGSKNNLYRHVVQRAQIGLKGKLITTKIPLLPALELLSPITDPPLKPKKEIEGKMIFVEKSK